MSDSSMFISDKRIAADILIVALQRGGGNSEFYPDPHEIQKGATRLGEAFVEIYGHIEQLNTSVRLENEA